MSNEQLLREAASEALLTLDGIADTNPRDKADFENKDEWITWAKSRAKWAADKLREPIARELYAERVLKQMLEQDTAAISQPTAASGEVDCTEIAFEAWWLREGQYLRSGGGDYEKTFAYHAWLASLSATTPPASQPQATPAEPVQCVACEGKPTSDNSPCAVCGKTAEPARSCPEACNTVEKCCNFGCQKTEPAQTTKCRTCNGHGLIGGHMQDGSGYGEPCPDCNSEPAQAVELPDLESIVDEYLGDYELRVDEGSYSPSEADLFLIKDALFGLLEDDDFKAWQARAALSARGQGLAGWQPIETAPENMTEIVVVRWEDSEGNEQHDLDYTEDGCWIKWHEHAEHVEVIGGHGVSYTPPYTHWMPLPPPPSINGLEVKPSTEEGGKQ